MIKINKSSPKGSLLKTYLSSDLEMEGRSINMLVTPLDIEDVVAGVQQLVAHAVPPLPLVLDQHLVTRLLRAVDADKQDVIAGSRAVHCEGVLLAEYRALEAGTMASDLACVRG